MRHPQPSMSTCPDREVRVKSIYANTSELIWSLKTMFSHHTKFTRCGLVTPCGVLVYTCMPLQNLTTVLNTFDFALTNTRFGNDFYLRIPKDSKLFSWALSEEHKQTSDDLVVMNTIMWSSQIHDLETRDSLTARNIYHMIVDTYNTISFYSPITLIKSSILATNSPWCCLYASVNWVSIG